MQVQALCAASETFAVRFRSEIWRIQLKKKKKKNTIQK